MATKNSAATLWRVRHENCYSSLGRPQGRHAMLTRSAFPVSLPYRYLENFNGAFNFSLTSRLACVPIDHYCFSDVQHSIVNLLSQCRKNDHLLLSSFFVSTLMYAGPYCQYKLTTKKKHERPDRVTDRTTLFSRHAVHRTGYSSDDLRGVDGQENTRPPVAYISDLICVSSHVFQLAEKLSLERNNK